MTVYKDTVESSDQSASARYEELMGYGRFQKFQVWVFASLVCFIGALNMFQLTFITTARPHRCALPDKIEER